MKQKIFNNTKKKVRRTLKNGISCYRKMHEEKKKATSVQTTLDKYFSKKLHIHFSLVL
jgi:hypothetical protein